MPALHSAFAIMHYAVMLCLNKISHSQDEDTKFSKQGKMDEAAEMSGLLLCPYFEALASTEEIIPQLFAYALCLFANANYKSTGWFV